MLTLSSTLTKAQKAQAGEQIAKGVLVKGATRYAYTIDDLLVNCHYVEEGIAQKADFNLENEAGTFTNLDFRGYTLHTSLGFRTGVSRTAWVANTAYSIDDIRVPTTANGYQYRCSVAGTSHATVEPTWSTTIGAVQTDGTVTWEVDGRSGDEFARRAPLIIIAPNLLSYPKNLKVAYAAAGKGNQLGMDKASADYLPPSTNTDTIKTIITAIMGATLSCYSHCTAITVTYDSEDNVIDAHIPADTFRISYRETRKAKVEYLLSLTKCVGRFEADGNFHIRKLVNGQAPTWEANTAYLVNDTVKPVTDNGHIYKCTTAGTSHVTTEPTWTTTEGNTNSDGTVTWTLVYDYSYNDIDSAGGTNHLFWADSHRRRIVLPNKITIESDPSHSPSYSATATDSDSNNLLDVRDFHRMRLASSAMASRIANARLVNEQRAAERGSATVPMNVGQQMYDLVRLVDTRSGASQIGNVGYLDMLVSQKPGRLSKSGRLISGNSRFDMSLRLGSPSMGVPMGISAPEDLSAQRGADNIQDLASWTQENLQRLWDDNNRTKDTLLALSLWVDALVRRVNEPAQASRIVYIKVLADDTALTTGDGKMYFTIPQELSGKNLVYADAAVYTVSSSGLPTIQIHNATDTQDMLSTLITIDASEKTSFTAATRSVVNASYDDVAVGDQLRIDVDVAGTGTKGLDVILIFQ